MAYGSQQWSGLMSLDTDELMQAYHCVSLIKKAEADATKDEATKAAEVRRAAEERARALLAGSA